MTPTILQKITFLILLILVSMSYAKYSSYSSSENQDDYSGESWNTSVNYNWNTSVNYNDTFASNRFGIIRDNRYDIMREIHGIAPYSNILPKEYNSGIFPEAHPRYVVQNIGRVKVFAKTIYGTAFGWIGDVSSYTIQPTVRQVLETFGRLYYCTGVKIYNEQSTRAIVHVYGSGRNGDNDPWDGFDKNKALKGAFAMGVKYIPYVGGGLSALISAFWPENKPSVWEQVQEQVKTLLDDKIQQTISGILDGDIRYMREKIASLDREVKGTTRSELSFHYMNIAQDLIGFEQKFQFTAATTPDYLMTNFNILPQYTTVITMKMHFYAIGIAKPEMFELNSKEVNQIKRYACNTIYGTNSNGAINYVRKMYKEVIDELYTTVYTGGLYNVMMNARSHIVLHGLELIPLWEMAYNEPGSDKNPYIDTISYSNAFGRATANLFQQATPAEVTAPLTPPLKSDKTRAALVSIEFYIWRIYGKGEARIGGVKLTFDNSDTYTLGTILYEVQRLDLNGRTITKLRAYGRGAVDSLVFTLSDGTTVTFGKAGSQTYADFELKDHHISSLYLASDSKTILGGQAANVAVSFLQNPIKK